MFTKISSAAAAAALGQQQLRILSLALLLCFCTLSLWPTHQNGCEAKALKEKKTQISSTFEYMLLLGRLKSTPRTGWGYFSIPNAESIADHMYRMAALCFLVDSSNQIDKDKCIKLSLVHDMAECIVGDITILDNVTATDKYNRERIAMEHIVSLLGVEAGEELYGYWTEYEERATPEAIFVKDLDLLDSILQAFEYEVMHNRQCELGTFFETTEGHFRTKIVSAWVDELYKVREQTCSAAPVKTDPKS